VSANASAGAPIVVVIRATDPARIAEGVRAGLGLTLRGDRVVVHARGPLPAPALRAAATLRSFGHDVIEDAPAEVVAAAIRAARAVEVWT
jgi:hypothetical protein